MATNLVNGSRFSEAKYKLRLTSVSMDFQQNRRPLTGEKQVPPHRLRPIGLIDGSMPGSGENQPQNHPHGKEKPRLLEYRYLETESFRRGVEEDVTGRCVLHRAAERDGAPVDQSV